MKKKAIFLDRDGTINALVPNKPFIDNLDDVKLLPYVKEWLKKLKSMGYLLIVITNQTWVGAGYYTKELAESINDKIQTLLWFKFDAIYSCYHYPDPNCSCGCRKPATWNVEKAIKDFNIDVKQSYFVWDKEKDILTWKKVWCKATFLIWESTNTEANYVVKNFKQVVDILEKDFWNT